MYATKNHKFIDYSMVIRTKKRQRIPDSLEQKKIICYHPSFKENDALLHHLSLSEKSK